MKTFKRIDLIGQLVLIVTFLITTLAFNSNAYMLGYVIVGAWQLISMLVHSINKWHNRKGSARSIYHTISAITIIMGALSFTVPFMFYFLFVLLFVAPVLAISYAAICYKETIYYTKRPLELI